MRLITSDNVEQLTALTDSGNIIKLTGNLTSFEDVKAETQRRLFAAEREEKTKAAEKETITPSPDPQDKLGPFAPPSTVHQLGNTVVWQAPQSVNPFAPTGVQIPAETMVPTQVAPQDSMSNEATMPPSPEYNPTTPESDTPDSGPSYQPPSPTPSPQSPEWANLPNVGEMIIWNGDPHPGRVWRIAEISVPEHTMTIIPGSFTGPDRITIPFKDAYPLPNQSSYSPSIDYGDDVHGFMDYGPQDTLTGDPKAYDPALAKRISEVGYTEAFREHKEKEDADANTALPSDEDGAIPKPIIIRTPVVEKDDADLDLLNTVDEEIEEPDEGDANIKKLITKKDS